MNGGYKDTLSLGRRANETSAQVYHYHRLHKDALAFSEFDYANSFPLKQDVIEVDTARGGSCKTPEGNRAHTGRQLLFKGSTNQDLDNRTAAYKYQHRGAWKCPGD